MHRIQTKNISLLSIKCLLALFYSLLFIRIDSNLRQILLKTQTKIYGWIQIIYMGPNIKLSSNSFHTVFLEYKSFEPINIGYRVHCSGNCTPECLKFSFGQRFICAARLWLKFRNPHGGNDSSSASFSSCLQSH